MSGCFSGTKLLITQALGDILSSMTGSCFLLGELWRLTPSPLAWKSREDGMSSVLNDGALGELAFQGRYLHKATPAFIAVLSRIHAATEPIGNTWYIYRRIWQEIYFISFNFKSTPLIKCHDFPFNKYVMLD